MTISSSKYQFCFEDHLIILQKGLFKSKLVLKLNFAQIVGVEYKAPLEEKKWYQITLRYIFWTILTGLLSILSIADEWPSNQKALLITYTVNGEVATTAFHTKLKNEAFEKIKELLDKKQELNA